MRQHHPPFPVDRREPLDVTDDGLRRVAEHVGVRDHCPQVFPARQPVMAEPLDYVLDVADHRPRLLIEKLGQLRGCLEVFLAGQAVFLEMTYDGLDVGDQGFRLQQEELNAFDARPDIGLGREPFRGEVIDEADHLPLEVEESPRPEGYRPAMEQELQILADFHGGSLPRRPSGQEGPQGHVHLLPQKLAIMTTHCVWKWSCKRDPPEGKMVA
jgi:hypothetical protein